MLPKIKKDQIIEKLGFLSTGEHGPLDRQSLRAAESVVHAESDHGFDIFGEIEIKRWEELLAGAMLVGIIGIISAASLFLTVGHGSLAKISVANMSVKAGSSQLELEKQIETAAKNYKIKIKYADGTIKNYALSETGVTIDAKHSAKNAKKVMDSSWLDRLKWWQPLKLPLYTKTNQKALDAFVAKDLTVVKVAPKDASLTIDSGVATITPEEGGYGSGVTDAGKLVSTSAAGLQTTPLVLKSMKLPPSVFAKDLSSGKSKADALLAKSVVLTITGHVIAATPSDIGGWLDLSPVPNSKAVDVIVNSSKVLDYINRISGWYVSAPRNRVVATLAGQQVVLDAGSDGVEVLNKDAAAATIVKKLVQEPGVNLTLEVQRTAAKTVETQAYNKWFEVDTTAKRMYAYEGTALVRTFLISAGAPATPTVTGTYSIYAKYVSQTMTGANADGSHYTQPDVPYVNYFYGGYAIHGNYWRPASWFGNINSSHGCVGVPVDEGAWIYDWAPIGTVVVVHR